MTKLDIINQIAELKEIDYKNTLAITCIIEILIDKGLINRNDIARKAYELESMTLDEIRERRTNTKAAASQLLWKVRNKV